MSTQTPLSLPDLPDGCLIHEQNEAGPVDITATSGFKGPVVVATCPHGREYRLLEGEWVEPSQRAFLHEWSRVKPSAPRVWDQPGPEGEQIIR